MKVKVKSEKVGLKLNIQKTKIMASSPITSWQIDGETVETVANFIFGGLRGRKKSDTAERLIWSDLIWKSLQMLIAAMKLKDAYSLEGKLWPT